MDKTAALRACSLLEDFTDVGIRILASIAQERELREGTPIFVEGMNGDAMYVVFSGRVTISVKNADGQDIDVGEIPSGEAFGEMSLLGGSTRMASTRAKTDVELVEIRLQDFARLQKRKPQACLKLLIAISKRIGSRIAEDHAVWREMLIGSIGS